MDTVGDWTLECLAANRRSLEDMMSLPGWWETTDRLVAVSGKPSWYWRAFNPTHQLPADAKRRR